MKVFTLSIKDLQNVIQEVLKEKNSNNNPLINLVFGNIAGAIDNNSVFVAGRKFIDTFQLKNR